MTDHYLRSDGRHVAVTRLNDRHLVNALLKAVACGKPDAVVRPLAQEVIRRGLDATALDAASARQEGGAHA